MKFDLATARTLGNMITVIVFVGVGGLGLIAVAFPQIPTVVIQITAVIAVAAGLMVAVIWAGIALSLTIRLRLEHRR